MRKVESASGNINTRVPHEKFDMGVVGGKKRDVPSVVLLRWAQSIGLLHQPPPFWLHERRKR